MRQMGKGPCFTPVPPLAVCSSWTPKLSSTCPKKRGILSKAACFRGVHGTGLYCIHAGMAKGSQSKTPAMSAVLPSRSLICTSLTSSTVDGQLEQMAAAANTGADLAEVRVDLLSISEKTEWKRILKEKTLPVIVTNRASWEGGNAPVGEVERLTTLSEAAKEGAEFIDIELAAFDEFKSLFGGSGIPSPTQLILSHHNFDRPLDMEEIRDVYRRMVNADCDVCKIAMAARSAQDNSLAFAALAEAKDRPMIMLVMGELGQCSRVVGPKYGAFLTFASVGEGRESAPGQVATETLTGMYRYRSISSSTKLFGVIGNPVSHSMSPALHNSAFTDAGIDAVYVPLKVDDDAAAFIRTMIPHGFAGFSVTIPWKVPALDAMDEVESITEKIGAMNTVVLDDEGNIYGYNTDWVAAISAIEEGLEASDRSLTGSRVLCIGAGGAARGLAYGAVSRGAGEVVIVNRTAAKAESLVANIGEGSSTKLMEAVVTGQEGHFDVVMNATSVGMHPNVSDSPLPGGAAVLSVIGEPLVFDAVYNPLDTKLLNDARDAGCVCISGAEMFIRQAAEQFRLWFPEVTPNVDLMRNIVMSKLNR